MKSTFEHNVCRYAWNGARHVCWYDSPMEHRLSVLALLLLLLLYLFGSGCDVAKVPFMIESITASYRCH